MLTVKCYDMNCYAKSRLPSLEIKNGDLDKTAAVQSLHFYQQCCMDQNAGRSRRQMYSE